MSKHLVSFLALIALGSACSLIVDPSIDKLPCGDGDLCRDGYGCVAGKCVAGAEPVDDGGPSTPCGGCADGYSCDLGLNRCIQQSGCPRCQPGEHCEGTTCVPAEPGGVGAPCTFDSECTVGSCLLGATGSGVCGVPCGQDGDCAVGELCTTPAGASASFCLPSSFAMCTNQAACDALGGGAVCTLWNFGGTLTGACSAPRAGGGDHGAACASGSDCATGLCGADLHCTGPCATLGATADCPLAGESCATTTVFVGSAQGQVAICVTGAGPTTKPEGACCTGNGECDSGICTQRSDGVFRYCADGALVCSFDNECPAAWACDGGASLCAPSPSCTR